MRVSAWRQDFGAVGLVVAALLTLAGLFLAFTDAGATLIFLGWGVALASVCLCLTRRRVMAAAVIIAIPLWFVALFLAAVFAGYEVIRWRRAAA